MVGGWLDADHSSVGRWHFRSVTYDYSYSNNWCAAGEYTWTAPAGSNNSEGFALLISVTLNQANNGDWGRSASYSVDEVNLGKEFGRIDRNGQPYQCHNSFGFASLIFDISVALTGNNKAWWGRSATAHDHVGFFSPGDTNGTYDFEYANHSYGFANPNINLAS